MVCVNHENKNKVYFAMDINQYGQHILHTRFHNATTVLQFPCAQLGFTRIVTTSHWINHYIPRFNDLERDYTHVKKHGVQTAYCILGYHTTVSELLAY